MVAVVEPEFTIGGKGVRSSSSGGNKREGGQRTLCAPSVACEVAWGERECVAV